METVISIISGLLGGGSGTWIAGAVAALVAIGGIFLKGRSSGKSSERNKWQKRENEIEKETAKQKAKADAIARKRPTKSQLRDKLKKGGI